ncbi:MAG: phage major tail tube protein [Clostridia bacterium]|nr:phage major tail tube protein [Clostridia bacterium]
MLTGIVDFAVYEDGTEYLGLAKLGLPASQNKTFTVNGAGIPGDIDIPVTGAKTAQHVTIDFVDNQKAAYILAEERVHNLDCRAVHEEYNDATGQMEKHVFKHLLRVVPISHSGGDIAPASQQTVTNEFSVISRKDLYDGTVLYEYAPFSGVDRDASGVNRRAEVDKLLGRT